MQPLLGRDTYRTIPIRWVDLESGLALGSRRAGSPPISEIAPRATMAPAKPAKRVTRPRIKPDLTLSFIAAEPKPGGTTSPGGSGPPSFPSSGCYNLSYDRGHCQEAFLIKFPGGEDDNGSGAYPPKGTFCRKGRGRWARGEGGGRLRRRPTSGPAGHRSWSAEPAPTFWAFWAFLR